MWLATRPVTGRQDPRWLTLHSLCMMQLRGFLNVFKWQHSQIGI